MTRTRGPCPDAPPLEPAACHVLWADPADADPVLASLLDDGDRRRLAAIRRQGDRDRFVVGRGLVRLALSSYLGHPAAAIRIDRTCAACGGPHGKPRLEPGYGRRVEFSVSHSGDRVVAAFALASPVGIDVERVRPGFRADAVVADVLGAGEIAAWRRLADDERARGFYRYWVRKEAAAKSLGVGFSATPASFGVSAPGDPARLSSCPGGPAVANAIDLFDLDAGPGYAASIARVGGGWDGAAVTIDGSRLLAGWVLGQRRGDDGDRMPRAAVRTIAGDRSPARRGSAEREPG